MFLVLLVSLMIAPIFSFADDAKEMVMCRNNKIVRTVRVIQKDNECVTIYTKLGVDKDVGGGKNPSSCTKIVSNIRENLEKAGWKCRVVGEASVTE
jgi:hypothetical protein